MFTERQQQLIDFCKKAGYGWAKFATSVENQGRCTRKQEDTLCGMHNRIHDQARSAKNAQRFRGFPRKGGSSHNCEWDDHNLDAMASGYESNDRY